MNKKSIIVVTSVFILIILISYSTLYCSFATISNANNTSTTDKSYVLTGHIVSNISDSYYPVETIDSLCDNELLSISNNIISKINNINNIVNKNIDIYSISSLEQEADISICYDEYSSRTIANINHNDYLVTLNPTTGDLISFSQKDLGSIKENLLSDEELFNLAQTLFNQINMHTDYEFYSLKPFDEEIWIATFAKKYNDLFNPGEAIKFAFSGNSNNIVNLHILNYTFANNQINISESQAYNIAQRFINMVNATDYNVELQIVQPNYYWQPIANYSSITTFRLAYVFTCNNDEHTQIFIDASTGEVIGGNSIMKGGDNI